MPSYVKRTYLELKEGTSSKFYELVIEFEAPSSDASDTYKVRAKWGRIGTRGCEQVKYTGPIYACEREFTKLIGSKMKGGYQLVSTQEESTWDREARAVQQAKARVEATGVPKLVVIQRPGEPDPLAALAPGQRRLRR